MTALLVGGKAHDGPCPELISVPDAVARCPECGSGLLVQFECHEPVTGHVLEEGMSVDCEAELDEDNCEDDDLSFGGHRRWQGEWQPVIDRVWAWAATRVTVANPAPPEQEFEAARLRCSSCSSVLFTPEEESTLTCEACRQGATE